MHKCCLCVNNEISYILFFRKYGDALILFIHIGDSGAV